MENRETASADISKALLATVSLQLNFIVIPVHPGLIQLLSNLRSSL
jgi:hypothetical protein